MIDGMDGERYDLDEADNGQLLSILEDYERYNVRTDLSWGRYHHQWLNDQLDELIEQLESRGVPCRHL